MYTVEFQKRGLPHAHFLIILSNEHKLLTVEAYDDIIRTELPDDNAESDLRKLVIRHMMHGPCGSLNPTNSYTKNSNIQKSLPIKHQKALIFIQFTKDEIPEKL